MGPRSPVNQSGLTPASHVHRVPPGRLHREAHRLPVWVDAHGYFMRLARGPDCVDRTLDQRKDGLWVLAFVSFCDILNTEQVCAGDPHLPTGTHSSLSTGVRTS